MAGGIEWFRWHHGSVNDQKFGLVAKKAGASVAEVIAVWACLLESASAADERGNPGIPDFESMDFALGMADGKSKAIHDQMMARSLIDADTGRVSAWDKRQPKREREDDNSTGRSRKHRAMQRHATPEIEDATPCNAMQRHATPRVEESSKPKTLAQPSACAVAFDEFWSAYPKKRSKGDAEKAWKALKPDEHLRGLILAAVQRAKTREDWSRDDGKFIPYPASWLRGKGWEDSVEVEALTPSSQSEGDFSRRMLGIAA